MYSKPMFKFNSDEDMRNKYTYSIYWYIRDIKIYIMEFDSKEAMDAWVAKVCKASFDGVFLNGVQIFYEMREAK